jgi:hypothetical protein
MDDKQKGVVNDGRCIRVAVRPREKWGVDVETE